MPQEDYPMAEIRSETASKLGDYVLLEADLVFGKQAIERLLTLRSGDEADSLTVRSLYYSTLVAYARCFRSGVRTRLDPSIYSELPGDPLGFHEFLINTRNKLIAHSVNSYEECAIGVFLNPIERNDPKIVGVAQLMKVFISHEEEGLKMTLALIQVALAHVAQQGRHWNDELLTEANEMDLDRLYRSARPRLYGNDPASAGARRT